MTAWEQAWVWELAVQAKATIKHYFAKALRHFG